MTNKSVSTELAAMTIPMKIVSTSSSSLATASTTTVTGNLTNRIIKSPTNQTETLSTSNLIPRADNYQELTPTIERKTFSVRFFKYYINIVFQFIYSLGKFDLTNHRFIPLLSDYLS